MWPADLLIANLGAALLVVLSPGPDNMLAVSRGLSQGPLAGALSSRGAGPGILCHTVAAALGMPLLAAFAAQLSAWLARRPRAVVAANIGAGATFIAAGLSILLLGRRNTA